MKDQVDIALENAHQEIEDLQKIIYKIEDFANNQYLEGIESTTSFSGGYAQALKDLKQLLETE